MLIWVVLIVLLVATAVVLSLTVFFHIQNITIEGNDRYSQEDISTHLTVDVGENLFLADTKSASARLEQSLPYIYNAEIKRKLPSTINVTITECEPSFYIITKDKTIVLLDKDFKVLETEADKQKGIRINSAKVTSAVAGQKIVFEDEAVGECLEKLASTIIDNDFEKITSIYSNNISDNYVVYDGRIKFKLGTCENLEGKMFQAFASCDDLNRTSPNAKGTLTVNGGKQIYFTEE